MDNKLFISFFIIIKAQIPLSKPSPVELNLEARYLKYPDSSKFKMLINHGKDLLFQYPDSALQYFTQALKLADQLHWDDEKAACKNLVFRAHYVLGEYSQALPYAVDALTFFEKKGDHQGIANSLNYIGLIYQTQKKYDWAIRQHLKAIAHAKGIQDSGILATIYFNMALAHDETHRYDSAQYYLNLSLANSLPTKDYRLVAMAYNRMGEVYLHKKQFEQAEQYYLKALNYPEHKSNWETCFSLAGLSQTYGKQGAYNKSIEAGLKSLELGKKMKANWEILRVSKILADTYAQKREFEKAYEMAILAQQCNDSIFNESKEREINYVNLKETELEKVKLEQQNAVQQHKIKQQEFQFIIAIVIGISFLCVALFMLALYQYKRKLNNELRLMNNEIELKNKELHELNQTKNRLFSIISHDMRSPFLSMQALLKLIEGDYIDAEAQKNYFGKLQRTFKSVSGTLDGLLQWASSQMDGVKNAPISFNLDDVVDSQIAFWQSKADDKGITILHKKSGFDCIADVDQIKTVIRNLIGNALKFTNASGKVSIEYLKKENQVGILVRDTGTGMTEEMVSHLFNIEKKYQREGTAHEKSMGLGLIICKQLVEKNKGYIEVHSVLEQGSTFTVWLPSKIQ